MEGSGPPSLLYFLRNIDLKSFNVRKPPVTTGLLEQKIQSLKNIERWWFDVLCAGTLTDGAGRYINPPDWRSSEQRVDVEDVRASYQAWMRSQRFQGETLSDVEFGRKLRKLVPDVVRKQHRNEHGTRVGVFVIPALDRCRTAFEALLQAKVDWNDLNGQTGTIQEQTEDDLLGSVRNFV